MFGQSLLGKYVQEASEKARAKYINSLINKNNKEILREFNQIMLDILDLVEQSDEEQHVISALEAFEKSIKSEI